MLRPSPQVEAMLPRPTPTTRRTTLQHSPKKASPLPRAKQSNRRPAQEREVVGSAVAAANAEVEVPKLAPRQMQRQPQWMLFQNLETRHEKEEEEGWTRLEGRPVLPSTVYRHRHRHPLRHVILRGASNFTLSLASFYLFHPQQQRKSTNMSKDPQERHHRHAYIRVNTHIHTYKTCEYVHGQYMQECMHVCMCMYR